MSYGHAASANSATESVTPFLELVTPEVGFVTLAFKTASGFKHVRLLQAQVPALVAQANAHQREVWFAPATQKEAGIRNRNGVAAAKAFWLDIDCGLEKPYADQCDAARALKAFCAKLRLPVPLVVNSGNGLHVWFPLDKPLLPSEWLPVARGLKSACRSLGLHADPSRTADIASLMRLPGTFNRKDPLQPKPVRVVHYGS